MTTPLDVIKQQYFTARSTGHWRDTGAYCAFNIMLDGRDALIWVMDRPPRWWKKATMDDVRQIAWI